jgi:hypothetical protein
VAKTKISLIIARDHAMTVRSGEFCKLLVHCISLYHLFGRKARFLALGVALTLEIDLHKLLSSLFQQSVLLCTLALVEHPFMQGFVVINGHNQVAVLSIMGQ